MWYGHLARVCNVFLTDETSVIRMDKMSMPLFRSLPHAEAGEDFAQNIFGHYLPAYRAELPERFAKLNGSQFRDVRYFISTAKKLSCSICGQGSFFQTSALAVMQPECRAGPGCSQVQSLGQFLSDGL